MDYKNKIRLRIGLATCYLVIGLLLILFQGKSDADFSRVSGSHSR